MKNNDWKERLNVVYSTNPDYQYENVGEEETETLPKNQQKLRVSMEKKGRGGKTVTLVRGFVGAEEDLKDLGKLLKTKCGVGKEMPQNELIYPPGIPHHTKMGAFVLLDINGADLHLVKGNTVFLQRQQHIGLVLKAVTLDGIKDLQRFSRNGTQAGLGVGDLHAAEYLKHRRCDAVALAAAGRYMGQAEIPHAKGQKAVLCHMQSAGLGVLGMMLVIAVHRHHAQLLGAVFQEPGKGCLQRSALAPVDGMVQ